MLQQPEGWGCSKEEARAQRGHLKGRGAVAAAALVVPSEAPTLAGVTGQDRDASSFWLSRKFHSLSLSRIGEITVGLQALSASLQKFPTGCSHLSRHTVGDQGQWSLSLRLTGIWTNSGFLLGIGQTGSRHRGCVFFRVPGSCQNTNTLPTPSMLDREKEAKTAPADQLPTIWAVGKATQHMARAFQTCTPSPAPDNSPKPIPTEASGLFSKCLPSWGLTASG